MGIIMTGIMDMYKQTDNSDRGFKCGTDKEYKPYGEFQNTKPVFDGIR